MVVSVLSVLTVSLAFAAWRIMETQYMGYRQETEEALSFGQLQMLLGREFMNCQWVGREDNKLVFKYPQYDLVYEIGETAITRKLASEEGRADVFKFPVSAWATSFRGTETSFGTTDFASLQVLFMGQPIALAFSKTYSAQEILDFNHAD